MMASVGSIDAIKTALKTVIQEADASLTVVGDWRVAISQIYAPKSGLKLPICTVRISPVTIRDVTFSRKVPESGSMATCAFSIHVFAIRYDESDHEKYYNCHRVTEKIIQHLTSINWGTGTHADLCIVDCYDLSARESEPSKGARRICRMIVEGMVSVKRED